MAFTRVSRGSFFINTAQIVRASLPAIQCPLELLNSDFSSHAPAERRRPRVRLLTHADAEYFPVGAKHRCTRP